MKYSLTESINHMVCFDFEYLYTTLVDNEIQRRKENENKGGFSR
jgi:hypothetical protein